MGPLQVGHADLPAQGEAKDKHFESVYKKHYRKIYALCLRYSAKPDDAEDLAHDVFMRYFQNFERFRHESCPSTWMYKVAVNLGIQRWRRDRIQYLDSQELESIPEGTQDNEIRLLDRITLMKIFDRCPERTRKILSLFHIERMTQIEICKSLGISRTTVARHLIHLKQFRRRRMERDPVLSLSPMPG